MQRIVLLLLPLLALAAGPDEKRMSKEESLGKLWQESLAREKGGETDAAVELSARYAREGGDAYLASLRTAWLLCTQKDYANAAKHYANASRLQPAALNPRLGMLHVSQATNDAAATLRAAEAVLAADPNNLAALYAASWSSFQAKNFRKADSVYRKILSLYPEDTDALSGAAWSNFYQGQKVTAKQFFRRLVAMNPDYPDALKGLDLCK